MSNVNRKPGIRFKGFTDDWEQKELGEFCNITTGKLDANAMDENGQYDFYTSGIAKYKIDIPAFEGPAITIAGNGATVGYMHLADGLFNAYQRTYVLSNFLVDRQYIFYAIGLKLPEKIAQEVRSGSIPYIVMDMLKELFVYVPNETEQQKIGLYFKNLDKLITLQQEKLEKLKNIKKACLEKMFPKEGCKFPEVRFKGFTDDWEQNNVSAICSISTGKSNTQDAVENGIYPFYVRSSIIERSNKYLFDEEAVLTVGDGVGTGKVFHYVNGKYDLHQRVYRLFDFKDIHAKYFYYYFSLKFYNRVMMMTAKTSVDSVRLEMIADMPFEFPKDINEQEKIAVFFDNLDKLITLQQEKLEKLKNIKKACLEEMFV